MRAPLHAKDAGPAGRPNQGYPPDVPSAASPLVEAVIRVGIVEIDPRRFEVRRDSVVVNVEPRVFDFLFYLARNRDRVISKAELVTEVWKGSHVGDAALARCASLARKALGSPTIIVTVHRRGYRWE